CIADFETVSGPGVGIARGIGEEVTENSGARLRSVDDRYAKRLIDWLREIYMVLLKTAEEESLVLPNRPADFGAVLSHSNLRLGGFLRVSEPLIRVQRIVAEKEEPGAMKIAGAAPSGYGD